MTKASGGTRGIIVNYHIAYTKEVFVTIPGFTAKKQAARLVGKKATWTDPKGKRYVGTISGLHGRHGTLKVKFKEPLPPTALAKPIDIA
jgi:ribosomal protein L35AE/L33A